MASTLDLSGLTLNPQEAESASQAIFETVYAKPELNAAHAIMTGMLMKQQIPIFGLMGDVGAAHTSCTPPASSETVAASQKYAEPKMVGFSLTHCQADVNTLFKMWKKSLIAKNQWEDIDNEMVTFLSQRIVDASVESQLRLSSFGDTAAALVSGGGSITNTKTVALINVIDGLWKQIETAVTAGDVTRITIAENAEATKAAQGVLGASTAYDTLKAMVEGADARLSAYANAVFQVTRSLYDNLNAYLESKSLNAGFLERTENGVSGLKYRGIPIIVRHDWDRNIRAWFDDGTKWKNPHRAILTPIANIPIITSDEESMKSVEMFYDKKDKQHYIDVDYTIDVKLLEEYKLVAAY